MLFLLCLLLLLWPCIIRSQPHPCRDSTDCERLQGNGSVCRDDHYCSNAYEKGCLFAKLPGWTKLRVCNSDDPETAQGVLCQPSSSGHMEIRVSTQNWDSAIFESWILQIVLSEILDVPTTLETGTPEVQLNFYNTNSSFQYGDVSYDWSALKRASELKDCQKAYRNLHDPNIMEKYQSCAHLITEVWVAQMGWADDMVKSGVLEPAQGLGTLGISSWYIPKFTAFRDYSLLTYIGLQGDENRRKLADTFLRPTTWKDYCTQVSTTNCSADLDVALRPPMNESENDRMFVPDVYFGHFRKTEENDCDKWPQNCTGHIADYPCGWTSFVTQLTYHLDIALKGSGSEPGCGGYSYQQLTEIWAAANWTNSNVIMNWWTPEPLYQSYMGSDAEFQKIALPPATQQCVDHRVSIKDRCDAQNATARYGSPLGACEETTNPLSKILASGLFDATYKEGISEALISPGYSAISLFTISTLQLGDIFDLYFSSPSPREAVCQWVVDNLGTIDKFIPRTYPRVLIESNVSGPILHLCLAFGAISCFLVLCTLGMVYHRRERRVMRVAQVEFMVLILTGSFLITVGAIMMGVKPSNDLCIAIPWLLITGYTLQLVPLIVKVAAINRLMIAAKRMRRIIISRQSLFGAVLFIVVINVVFLALWTSLDPPQKQAEYDLTTTVTDDGETIVWMQNFCGSQSNAWWSTGQAWTALLLVCATVLAFQTRNVQTEFNESQALTNLIYFNFVFVLLRVITYFMANTIGHWKTNWLLSISYSIATIGTLFIYFLPKFITPDHAQKRQSSSARTDLAPMPSNVSISSFTQLRNPLSTILEANQPYQCRVIPLDSVRDVTPVQHCMNCGHIMHRHQHVASEVSSQAYSSSNENLNDPSRLSRFSDDGVEYTDVDARECRETVVASDSVASSNEKSTGGGFRCSFNEENMEEGSGELLQIVRLSI